MTLPVKLMRLGVGAGNVAGQVNSMAKFVFGDVVNVADDDRDGMVVSLSTSSVTVMFENPSEYREGQFSYTLETCELDDVELA
jgi:hypothetical protein